MKIDSSSPSENMHLMVPSGNLFVKINYNQSLNLHDFFCSIWEMFFNLLIWKFKDLKTIRIGCLSSFSFSKIINNFLIRISLFDIIVIEVNNCVSIRECFSFHSIAEDNLFLSILISSLNLTIIANYLILNSYIFSEFLVMIFL